MRKQIKCYLAFAPKAYRWFLFLLVPLLVICLQLFLGKEWLLLEIGGLLWIEIIADYFIFGGIAAANVGMPEYLKASAGGIVLVRRALVGNMLRQLAESIAVPGITMGLFFCKGEALSAKEILVYAGMVCWSYLLLLVSNTVGRFFESIQVNLLLGMGAACFYVLGFLLIVQMPWGMLVLSVLLAIAVGIRGIRLLQMRLERSYYDRVD